jgi:hypothetical protein
MNLKLYLSSNFDIPINLMRQPSLLRLGHHFYIEFQRKVSSSGLQLHNIWRPSHVRPPQLAFSSYAACYRSKLKISRAFSSSPTSQRFKLQLGKTQQPEMAPEMTTLKGQPLDRAVIDSLLRRRFFYAPTADVYG